jgi:hypothetical protein
MPRRATPRPTPSARRSPAPRTAGDGAGAGGTEASGTKAAGTEAAGTEAAGTRAGRAKPGATNASRTGAAGTKAAGPDAARGWAGLRRVGVLAVAAVAIAAGGAALARAGAGSPAGGAAVASCPAAPAATGAGHDHQHTYPHQPGPRAGLAASEGALRLDLDRSQLEAGAPNEVTLRVTDGGGVARLERTGTVPMHVYLVRDDLGSYEHVHPRPTPDCGWKVAVRPPGPGAYRLFAEFRPGGRAADAPDVVLSRPLTVPGPAARVALPPPAATATAGPYVVTLGGYATSGGESLLTFDVSRDGAPVRTLSPYLGEMAHVSVFREGTAAFNHAHPLQAAVEGGGPRLTTPLLFPGAGTYRVFVQFVADGEVRTAGLTVPVR